MYSLLTESKSALFDTFNSNTYHLRDVVIALCVIVPSYYAFQKHLSYSRRQRYAKQAKQKHEAVLNQQHACFDRYEELIKPEIESLILSLSATQIRENIINNKISCVEAVLVIAFHTHQCNKQLNAVLEAHYDRAFADALELDQLIENKRNSTSQQEWSEFVESKQLLGIPISIKDLFVMKDSDCTIGLTRLCNRPYSADGNMLQLVREHSGIPYCKTNCPQINMLPESINHIIGATNNPYNAANVAGGSTGGDAALVAAGASKLGIGSDIGGSLRMPANFCGCIAYKPSSRRSMQTGKGLVDRETYPNKFGIVASQGPLAMCMDDIVRFLKVMWSPSAFNEHDVYMAPMPFRNEIFLSQKKLTIGYWKEGDGWFTSTKCVQRAISNAVEILQKEYNYDVVELPFKDGAKVWQHYFTYMGAETSMKEFLRALDDTEELYHGFKKLKQIQDIPSWIKHYIIKPILPLLGEHRKCELLVNSNVKDLSLEQFKNVCKELIKFKYEFWRWLDSFGHKIDCIVCPVNFYPAPKHNFSANMLPTLTSTMLQNILDCAAGAYGPVAFVQKNECHYDLQDLPLNERDSYSRELDGYMKDAYGLPIDVQIFSKPYDDEIVLRVMHDLEKYYKRNPVQRETKLITEQKQQ